MTDYLETMRLLPRSSDNKMQKLFQIDGQSFSVAIVLVTLGFMYSVHNLIAPNMTAIARLFHFNAYERDAYIGGELTLFFYFPGVFGALIAGVLSGMMERKYLLAALAVITSVTCLLTARCSTFRELAWARATTGFAIGGSLPVVYSLIGDWFPASRRASATAYVTAASGAGVFLGQCVATLVGTYDWRLPFVVVALPTAIAGVLIWQYGEEPARGGQESGVESLKTYQQSGMTYMPTFSYRHLKALMHNKTNVLVIIQAFPGNIPWGVIVVYMHDFLVQDIGMSMDNALGAIATLSAAAFGGVITGGIIGEWLYKTNSKHLAIFGGICNMVRSVPFFLIFGWKQYFGPLEKTGEAPFFIVLILGGFVATMASPCTGAMLLNVNLPETRGSVMAMYSVLDDLSKGFGTLFVSMIVHLVGGRAVAYQMSLLLWAGTGVAMLLTYYTYEHDEDTMRRNLEESAAEAIVSASKHRAQQAVRDRARAAGEAHRAFASTGMPRPGAPAASNSSWPALRWPTLASAGIGSSDPVDGAGIEEARPSGGLAIGSGGPRTTNATKGPQPGRAPGAAAQPDRGRLDSGIGRTCDERDRLRNAVRAAAAATTSARKV
jgi:predicted MFS family arabinose efflux permease